MISFGSDNHTGVHPKLLDAVVKANAGHAPSYGTDRWSDGASAIFKDHFGAKASAFFVFNGTGSNVVALRALLKPWESCLVSDVSHLNQDECGAPELLAGKLIPLKSEKGKLSLSTLKEALVRRGDQHYAQVKAVSLSQPTELGTCYTQEEIAAICEWAHQNQLQVHVDGARIANAAHFLKCTFRELITQTGVDLLSFGGTKNGFLMGEAVVCLRSELEQDLKYIRKQSLQLPSKTRFIAAQFETYLGTSLWQEIAQQSHQAALKLNEKSRKVPGVMVTHVTESNAVFAQIPKSWVKSLRDEFFFYVWNPITTECRWMTSWDTEDQSIESFCRKMHSLSEQLGKTEGD